MRSEPYSRERLDTLVLVPFEPERRTLFDLAFAELEELVGIDLASAQGNPDLEVHPGLSPFLLCAAGAKMVVRSSGALVLSSCAERAGLRWATIDPYERDLGWWKRKLGEYAASRPHTVAINTTFLTTFPWTANLARIVRQVLPDAKILIGGYQYATNTKAFLRLDADLFCIGEGELRFAGIVKACRDDDEAALERIPGLMIRGRGGELKSTGHAPPIKLDEIALTDYSLSSRIDPPLDITTDHLDVHVETQRGCMFACQFCTFRTIQLPEQQDPAIALNTILATRAVKNGFIGLQDATATTPTARWDALMKLLVDAGGTPHPMWCYTRVTDLNEQRAEMMARAGLAAVQIGQESGDQRILDLMVKGTKVKHVKPALGALHRAGLVAEMSFIHGYPGESPESIEATRNMILSLNDGYEARPVVLAYGIQEWIEQDLAAVKATDGSPTRFNLEQPTTMIAASKLPHAPASRHVLRKYIAGDRQGIGFLLSKHRYEFFKLAKGVDLAFGAFLEHQIEGTPIDADTLARAREQIWTYIRPITGQRKVHLRPKAIDVEDDWTSSEVIAEEPRTQDPAPQVDVLAERLIERIMTDRAGWKLKKKTAVSGTGEDPVG